MGIFIVFVKLDKFSLLTIFRLLLFFSTSQTNCLKLSILYLVSYRLLFNVNEIFVVENEINENIHTHSLSPSLSNPIINTQSSFTFTGVIFCCFVF